MAFRKKHFRKFRKFRKHFKKHTKNGRMESICKRRPIIGPKAITHKKVNALQYNLTGTYMPQRFRTIIKYSDDFNVKSDGGNHLIYRAFRMNSPWDPNWFSNAGDKVGYGHLELGKIYTKYRVYAAKIRVTYLGNNTTNSVNNSTLRVAMYPVTTAAQGIVANMSTASAQPMGIAKTVNFAFANDNNSNVLEQYVDIAALYGLKRESLITNGSFAALITENPSAQPLWILMHQTMPDNGGNYADYSVPITVEIVYYIEYYDRYLINLADIGTIGATGSWDTGPTHAGYTGGAKVEDFYNYFPPDSTAPPGATGLGPV